MPKCLSHCLLHTFCHTTRRYGTLRPLPSRSPVCLCAVVVGVLEKWAQHWTTDDAEVNVALWGSLAIEYLARGDPDSKAPWLAAGAERVLRGITEEDTSAASDGAKRKSRDALKYGLGLQA